MIYIRKVENDPWRVWMDLWCVGCGSTKKIALQDAKAALEEDLRYVNEQLKKEEL